MKILLLHNIYRHPGGEETYIKNLISVLRSHGHTVKYIYEKSERVNNWQTKLLTGLGLFWNGNSYSAVDRIIQKFKPDIVQVQNIFPLFSPSIYWACRKNNVPIVQRISNYRLVCPKTTLFRSGKICEACVVKNHSFLPSIYYGCVDNSRLASFVYAASFLFHKYILGSFRLIDAYIFPSEFTLKYITKHFSTDRSLAFHVPSPVLPHALPNTQKNREKYFIYAGRISVEKGVFTLISTFSQSRNAHMKLKIAGDGPDAEKIRALVHNSPNITVVGKLDKQALAPLISNALAMVAPSIWYDVQPNSVLESLSYQTPVIAPAHPVFNELLGKQKRFLYKNIRQFDDILNTVWRKREKTHVSLPQIHLPNSHYAQIIAIYQQLLAHR